jgi:trimeric autotransporter adhesin
MGDPEVADLRGPRRRAARGAAVALWCAAAAAAFLLAPDGARRGFASPGAWRGYRALLVEASADEDRVLQRLAAAGIGSAISESTEPVAVSDWSRSSTMTLAAAKRTLVPGDPRLDSYIQRLSSWFEAREGGIAYRVIYVPERALSDLSGTISKAIAGLGIRYFLPEGYAATRDGAGRGASFAVSVAVLAAAAAAGSLAGRPRPAASRRGDRALNPRALLSSALRLALAAPFAVAAWRGGWVSLAAVAWGLVVMDAAEVLGPSLEELRFGSGPRRALGAASRPGLAEAALAASAIAATVIAPATIPAMAAAVASSLAAAATIALTPPAGRRRFAPIPIGHTRRGPSVASAARAVLACAAVLASASIAAATGSGARASAERPGVSYPVPAAARGSVEPLPAEARDRLSRESTEESLPSLASWLAHMAYQESMPYARLGEARPDPFAAAALPARGEGGSRLEFGDEWARAAYRSIPARSIEGMLASQGGAVNGRFGDAGTSARENPAPLAPIGGLLYILLLIPPLARIAASIPAFRGTPSRGLRQEA